jgi:hypothetical protein
MTDVSKHELGMFCWTDLAPSDQLVFPAPPVQTKGLLETVSL